VSFDNTPRWLKVGDAVSQLFNVLILPRHKETSANESISGRAYRQGWKKTEKMLNFLFLWLEKDHCRLAYETDFKRAKDFIKKNQNG
jgi:hypothetical protein